MRIAELWLDAYGPFTGLRFPLSPDRLNVVFGPNEAGKSTSLRAIEALLFDHEQRSRDAHLHDSTKLRVGGRITTKAGLELSFIRRKGKSKTLLDPSGEPIDDALLVGMLGGVQRSEFLAAYGLDHIRLAEGGKALAQGEGLVGESLFAASMGIVHLHRLQATLEEEGDAIYTPRAKRSLNLTLDAVKKARDEIEIGSTSADTVAADRAALEKRIRDENELRERKRAYEKERNRLARVHNVRPPLMELRSVRERLDERGEPHIVDPKAREDAERMLAISGPTVERLEVDLGAAKAARASVPIDMKVLAYKEDIRGLWADRGAHVKAVYDRGGLEKELAELRRNLDALLGESEADLGGLDSAIKRAKGADVREEKIEAEEAAIRDLVESTEADLEALDLEANIGAALRLAVPSEEAIDEAERAFEPHRQREDDLENAVALRERHIRELQDEIASVRATSDTPTEGELASARAKRDEAVDALGAKGKMSEAVRAIAAADRIVDRMRADAEAVSTLALKQRELEAAEKAQARDRKALDDAKKQLAQLRKGWDKLWVKIEPGSPVEMRAWHRRFSEARDACAEIEKRRRDAKTERTALEKIHAELERAGKPHRIGGEAIGELLDRLREHHRKLEKSELGRTKEIEGLKERVQRLERRIADMDREAETFRSRVATLVRSIDPALAGIDDPITTIHERWVAAEQDRKLADSSDARVKELEAELAKARTSIAEAKSVLDRLLAASGADSIETLRRYEAEAREVLELRSSRTRLESEIARLGDARPIEELEAEAAQVAIEDARARIQELDRMVQQVSDELDDATRDVSGIQAGLKRYDEPLAQAAEATARVEQHLAHARELALRHARLKLASGILARAIERLRDKSQGPVIERASGIFHRLTLGGFQKLSIALDDKDQPILVGVRSDGRETNVLGMSDGTRDQLYLALRVASLERLAETGDPLPLVLDDVLMSFDDDRARAALGVLAELARKMQVLLFTHHARTVELAREAVPDLALRELPAKAAVSAA